MVRRVCICLVLFLAFFPSVMAFANEDDQIPDEYEDLLESLPNDVIDMLPEDIFSDNIDGVSNGVKSITSWNYIFDAVFEILGLNLRSILKVLAAILGLLVFCALLSMIRDTSQSPGVVHLLNLIGGAVTVMTVLNISREPLQRAMMLLQEIRGFVNLASPVICSMYAMGGNVSGALVHNYGLIVFLSILENICIVSLDVIVGVCLGLCLASCFVDKTNILPLVNAIKKAFTFFVGMIMLIFTTVISTQTLLAGKADTLSSRAAKMVASQMIPLVGGTIGETLRTAGASIEYLRSNVGVVLIIALVLMSVPTFISIALYRLVFIFSNAIAGLLGCKREGEVLLEISSIYGYVLAIISIASISLLLLITVFAKCSSPLT